MKPLLGLLSIVAMLAMVSVSPSFGQPSNESANVLFVSVGDVSGSMKAFIDRLRAAERDQLRRLVAGDVFARVEFDGDARVTALGQIRDADDLNNLLSIDQGRPQGPKTEISRGLTRAREIVVANGQERQVVLVLITDGELDPRDNLAAERQRLVDVGAWWKAQQQATKILVAPTQRIQTNKGFQWLAEVIDARIVPLDQFAHQSVATRAIDVARSRGEALSKRDAATEVAGAAPEPGEFRLALASLATVSLLIGAFAWYRRRRRRQLVSKADHTEAMSPRLPDAIWEVTLRSTSGGLTDEKVLRLNMETPGGAITIGGQGATVQLPGYTDAAIQIEVADARRQVVVPPRVPVWIGANRVSPAGGSFTFTDRVAIRARGTHVAVAVRDLRESLRREA